MLGRIVLVGNLERKHGWEAGAYFFVKVQHGAPSKIEEYLLLTGAEFSRFSERGEDPRIVSSEQRKLHRVGVAWIHDAYGLGLRHSFNAVNARLGAYVRCLLMTDKELERVRRRTERNSEDIEANKESWLADLLD